MKGQRCHQTRKEVPLRPAPLERPRAQTEAPAGPGALTRATPERGHPAAAVAHATGPVEDTGLLSAVTGGPLTPPARRPATPAELETERVAPTPKRAPSVAARVAPAIPRVPVEAVTPVVQTPRGPGADVAGAVPRLQAPNDGAGTPTRQPEPAEAAPLETRRPKGPTMPALSPAMVAARNIAIAPARAP